MCIYIYVHMHIYILTVTHVYVLLSVSRRYVFYIAVYKYIYADIY